jgi:hypothetical protein
MMTQDEIMFMAMKSGCPKENALANMDILEAFAKLVAEREREACAKVCDELSAKHTWEGCYANECAESIRARGQA